MIALSHEEAILLRILQSLFGREYVIPHMSVSAIVGGLTTEPWFKEEQCLFTIIDDDDNSKVVVEFLNNDRTLIDSYVVTRSAKIAPILTDNGIRYITISDRDYLDITSPETTREGLVHFFREKVGDIAESESHPEE